MKDEETRRMEEIEAVVPALHEELDDLMNEFTERSDSEDDERLSEIKKRNREIGKIIKEWADLAKKKRAEEGK